MATTEKILKKYGLTKKTATQYIDAITHLNQTQTAKEINVSRETIRKYKNTFARMTTQERSQLITTLTQEKLLQDSDE